MTNNPTIDGVSRSLLETIKFWLERAQESTYDSDIDGLAELRALLDAPAVERQEPVQMASMPVERCYDVRAKMIIAFNEAKKAGGDLDDALDAAYRSALRFSPAPNDFADQKSTIARLEARIAELESGRGEAPFYISVDDWNMLVRDDVEIASVRVSRARRSKFTEPLFTAPPAPVAVVLPELESSFEKWWEEDGQYCRSGGGSYEKTFAYRAYEACLDATAALNEPAK